MTCLPSALQRRWLDTELGLFCHFGINTFADKEWSDGTQPAALFHPGDFSAKQWADVAVAGGFRYLILTAKHHDGFCLWPTDTTDYSVRHSPWRGGRGDVVADVAQACRDAGLRFGLYLSPWDRHEPCYPDAAAYDRFYTRQLTELCTRYGELFELWFDGAGSEGRVYDWHAIMAVADAHQPHAMVFNMGRPTIRWVGNEDGLADDPNPLRVANVQRSAFAAPHDRDQLGGSWCLPAECDVPIRLNWFWHADDLHTLKSTEHLLGIYYRSVGRGSNLLLNLGPDTRGRLSDEDRDRWLAARHELDRRFAAPLTPTITADAGAFTLAWPTPQTLDHLVIQEDLARGQQVFHFTVADGAGRVLTTGHTIGHKRILPLPAVTTDRLVLTTDAPGAQLRSAAAYRTGHSTLPAVGAKTDYDAWNAKADRPAAP